MAKILITGASGKVGQTFLKRFFKKRELDHFSIRALCHNRAISGTDRLETVHGSISDQEVVNKAMEGVSHVVHLATCKEIPEQIMDVSIKGMFWLLEAARQSKTFERFMLIGGDAAMGHFFYPHPIPVTEEQKHSAYPGCYALSKVLEEVMLEQYYIQYKLDGCCLMAPWIMEKDDFMYSLSFGNDVFGGPRWCDMVPEDAARRYHENGTIPVLCDNEGNPVQRNFVHVNDLVDAMLIALTHPKAYQQKFNICMNEPVHYGKMADYLKTSLGRDCVFINSDYKSTWLDNSKARFLLEWEPVYDLKKLIDEAFHYKRQDDDPRKTWYPG